MAYNGDGRESSSMHPFRPSLGARLGSASGGGGSLVLVAMFVLALGLEFVNLG